ncbi:MAG: ATP-dependent 6-phosphofructokinase [Longibaculum sp.]
MEKKVKRIALLSGGGDCPGLNAVIRTITKTAIRKYGWEVIGYVYGYRGLYNNNYIELTEEKVEDIYKEGGTILYSSNKDNLLIISDDGKGGKVKKDVSDVGVENLKKAGVDVLVVLGGDGTLTSARDFSRKGVNVIGVPKTMDNDLTSTDLTYGFISAMSVGTDFIDRLQTTAKSHHRVICCELMGRDAGWIALYSGLAGNAGVCLIPEIPFTIENIAKHVAKRDAEGLPYTVIAVAEGAKYADGTKVIGKIVEDSPDPVRYSGLAAKVADDLEKVIPNHEVRAVNPGHIIRGGDITAYDRILSIRFGVKACELIDEGLFGKCCYPSW